MKDKDWRLREAAAAGLGEMKYKGAMKPLTEALQDEHQAVREAAKKALERIEMRR